MSSPDADVGPRRRLLDAAVAHLEQHGTHDLTLRGLASAIGTSHRMLSYHFGSRDGLLVAVSRAVEERQREGFALLLATPDATPAEVMWRMYHQLVDPALWPQERLFFDLYARALQGDADAQPLLEGVVDAWLEPLSELFARLAFTPEEALAEARLSLAVCRGLLLDLLATRDRRATDQAMAQWLTRYADRPMTSPSPPSTRSPP